MNLSERFSEVPVFFGVGDLELFGVQTIPSVAAEGKPVVLAFPGGAYIPGSHRNGMFSRLARRLASTGVATLRVDYHGVGDSAGNAPYFNPSEPFVDDVVGAERFVREQGYESSLIVATCFGARTAMAAARHVPTLRAMALLGPPPLNYPVERKVRERSVAAHMRRGLRVKAIRGLADPRLRQAYARVARAKYDQLRRRGADASTSAEFLRDMQWIAKRDMPVLLHYGEADEYYRDFIQASEGRLGDVIAGAKRIEIATCPGILHGFAALASQEYAIEVTCTWLSRILELPARDTPAAVQHDSAARLR